MNELLLQRCIDGAMTSTERGEFFAGLGDDVVHWKQLACRLLEDRELEAGCRDWITDIATPDPVANRVAQFSSAVSIDPALNGHALSNGKSSLIGDAVHHVGAGTSASKSFATTSRVKSNMALLVAGVLGIAIGLGLNGMRGTENGNTNLADGVAPDQSDADVSLADVSQAPAFSTIVLTLETPDGPQQYEVPVVGIDDLTTLASMESSISPALREQWSRQGYQLDEVPGVIKLPIDDATSVAVPVHAMQFRSVGL